MNGLDFFAGKKVTKPEFVSLPEGSHRVRVVSVAEGDSFTQYNGSPKEELPEWADATPQLIVTFVSTVPGMPGGITNRFNGLGYVKFDELDSKAVKSGKYKEASGYALVKQGDSWVRMKSEKHTAQAENILAQFTASLGMQEGDDLAEGLEEAIANQTEITIDVVNKPYEGKDQLRVTKFKAVANVQADFE